MSPQNGRRGNCAKNTVGTGQKVVPVQVPTAIFQYGVQARLSAHVDWSSCVSLAQFPHLPFCGHIYIHLLYLMVQSDEKTAVNLYGHKKQKQFFSWKSLSQFSIEREKCDDEKVQKRYFYVPGLPPFPPSTERKALGFQVWQCSEKNGKYCWHFFWYVIPRI